MSALFDSNDDKEVLEAILKLAHQTRKSKSPQKAITAAKVELFLSRSITEIETAKAKPVKADASQPSLSFPEVEQ